MLLEDENGVVYGGGGAIGGAVDRAFAREGAHVFLAGQKRSGPMRSPPAARRRRAQICQTERNGR